MKFNLTHPQRAASLLEVVIVLGIVAITMVGATQLTVSALVRVKQDELADFATGLSLTALEVVRNPDSGKIYSSGTVPQGQFVGSYSLEVNGQQNLLVQRSPSISKINSCPTNSAYVFEADIPSIGENHPRLCIQVVINQDNPNILSTVRDGLLSNIQTPETRYELEVRSVMVLPGFETRVFDYTAYRSVPFELSN